MSDLVEPAGPERPPYRAGQMLAELEPSYTDIALAIADSDNPYAVAIQQYHRQPNAFWREVLGLEPDPWQEKANRALAHGHTRLSIASGHGVGKSTWDAGTMCWFGNTRAPFKCVVTAPSAPQLFDALWGEVKALFRRLPPAWYRLWTILDDRIELKSNPDDCFISARTARADSPEALQGVHSKHVLLVVDEASGVGESVFEAASGSMSSPGAITVLTGNPTRNTGFFWRTRHIERQRWYNDRVSSRDSPRVTSGYCDEIMDRYGETSNQYRVRVLGLDPLQQDDTLIPADLIESAMRRPRPDLISDSEIWGVDCARQGSDDSCLVKRRGLWVPEMPRRWHGLNTMEVAGAVKAEWDRTPVLARPKLIAVDVIGIGAGVTDRLGEQGLPVLGVNVAESPSMEGRFVRLRDELWVKMREWLEPRTPSMPYDERLRTDLAAPRVKYLSDGRQQVESKDSLRSRGFASPDSGDALANTFVPAGMMLQSQFSGLLNDGTPVREAIAGME